MKGLVFKELISMMEQEFGEEFTEELLDEVELPSGGAYTSVGTYDHSEILALVTKLAEKSGHPGSALVKAFGKHLLKTFHGFHPEYFDRKDSIEFLKSVDQYIHVEVKKLTPEAELPKIDVVDASNGDIEIFYQSKRPFADLAEGLIEATVEHYKDSYELNVKDRSNPCERQFVLTKAAS